MSVLYTTCTQVEIRITLHGLERVVLCTEVDSQEKDGLLVAGDVTGNIHSSLYTQMLNTRKSQSIQNKHGSIQSTIVFIFKERVPSGVGLKVNS